MNKEILNSLIPETGQLEAEIVPLEDQSVVIPYKDYKPKEILLASNKVIRQDL